ncbi:signal recognition particle-docking protein FtsY [Synechococcus sp. CS-1325]|uniref:signal recognition particle-docking protein FtsY n=1 Tax=unclassified Synechococcus TaxID=2626047 RepID=UPI000DB784F2|nr:MULTISPECIES: signal recognition particle-docking protein FtsY [unclassified Synechococcus]MCT0199171.1 signal recognition particle-docking protein FtsY [Synechococcus sp. CS-1325]MCT0214650.1 signal recognition particle-docking protein FtsY [Synechococcus sp. CS-1326]MCT0233984.1 signal recognition particle-docking protein FtsY [Synechococcus sp. CS-1327]PZV02339.1 MAG: signal recognition particle-docking protein FtsY [Cyanobium sp.]
MVFDWFNRRAAPPDAPPDASPPAGPEPEQDAQERDARTEAPEAGSAEPSSVMPAVSSQPAPAPDGVDQEALAWARQAYARLKAEQQAAREIEPAANFEPEAPLQPSTESTSPALSLLEQAAAGREQRQAELLDIAVAPPPALDAEEAAPSLGRFDAEFSWSAEVLAAQGLQADQVSLEEIDWLGRLRRGLEKTRQGFVSQLLETLGDDPLTPEVLDDIESLLLRADVGVRATDRVLEALRQRLNVEVVDPAEGFRFLKEQLRSQLEQPIKASGRELLAPERDRLNVWLLVGVNGVGKTTTLGKLANLAVRSGYSCLIAAADTFRAAAVQQVTVWGERSGVAVIANPSANADPAAVVFDAIGAAKAKGIELVLVDTAGRLQTKHNLMEELAKVRRIIDKLAPEAAVESLLVLDASQGQNGLRQAMAFASAAGLTGVVLTKLDGSARGGVALAVASEAELPIRFIGAGEGIRDLRPFNGFEFVEALLAR